MTPQERTVLVELLTQLADDELIIGHRDSEWLGLAPHLEEDIAFSSIAQDEVGHANAFFGLLEALGEGKADDLAFLRPAAERKNAVLLERPNGTGTYLVDPHFDWGYAVARRLAYDLFDAVRLDVLAGSSYVPLARLAVKIRREEKYHLLHHVLWLKRLALGTDESRARLADGIQKAWGDVGGLFAMGRVTPGDIFPATGADLLERWTAELKPLFESVQVAWPQAPVVQPVAGPDGRRGRHTPELDALLETMGEVYRMAPGAAW
jgi:ring-1,2-phenylacetyl-CoA epoxidase subunit PaaC